MQAVLDALFDFRILSVYYELFYPNIIILFLIEIGVGEVCLVFF